MIEPQETLYIHQNWYDVDTTKLTSAKDIAELLTAMEMRVSPTSKNFDKVKKFLIIPEPHKTLDEISQELDEKFEKLIVGIKAKFECSGDFAERNYDWNFGRIIGNFEYAKEHGRFKETYTLDWSNLIATGSNVVSFTTQYRVGDSEVGYWDIKPNIKVYLEKKPNRIVRFFTKLLLDFEWKSTK